MEEGKKRNFCAFTVYFGEEDEEEKPRREESETMQAAFEKFRRRRQVRVMDLSGEASFGPYEKRSNFTFFNKHSVLGKVLQRGIHLQKKRKKEKPYVRKTNAQNAFRPKKACTKITRVVQELLTSRGGKRAQKCIQRCECELGNNLL